MVSKTVHGQMELVETERRMECCLMHLKTVFVQGQVELVETVNIEWSVV